MINHVRTLLLNETQTSLSEAGYDYGYPWYVSPSFSGVDIPNGLLQLNKALFSGCSSLDDRISRVWSIMSLLESVDMEEFLSVFDNRSTVHDRHSFSIRELFDNSKFSSSGFFNEVLSSLGSAIGLFRHVGNPDFDPVLDKLFDMAHGSFEAPLRVASIILAYCMQLENARTH